MLNYFDGYDVDRDAKRAGLSNRLLVRLAGIVCAIVTCITGCSSSTAMPTETQPPLPAQSIFSNMGQPSQCPARCISATVAIAREGLGLDPNEQKKQGESDAAAIFESLERDGRGIGSMITRVPLGDVIEKITEGPASPVVLINETGHMYVLFGAIRVNNRLLYQVIHGEEPVSLVTKHALLTGGFQETWRLDKKMGMGVPIHVGSAVVEFDNLWHNFGEVFPSKSPECTFQMKNVGDKTVVLGKPVTSCQCTAPSLGEQTKLAPGSSLTFKVVTKATGSTSLRNLIGLTLYEQGSGTSRWVQLALIGSQRESMEVTPRTLDFGLIVPGKPCSRLICLREKPTDRFLLKAIDPGELPITYKVERTKDKDGLATYRVHLELRVDAESSGEYRNDLILTTDSYVRPRVIIPVTFKVEPPVRTIPSVVSVGTVAVGELREQRVRLVSRGGEPLDIQIESHPDECSVAIDQKNPLVLIVKVKLEHPGIWQGTIKGRVQASSQEHMVEIGCAGYAQE